MIISLDYDDTYTRDPIAWNDFIKLMQNRGHTVLCVTMRYAAEGREVKEALDNTVEIFFTGRQAKQKFMLDRGINVSVWIDDSPWFITDNALPMIGMQNEN